MRAMRIFDVGDGTITVRLDQSFNTLEPMAARELARFDLDGEYPRTPDDVPRKYWAWDGNAIVEADAAVKAAIDAEDVAQQDARIAALAAIPVSATATLKDQVDALEAIIDWYIAQGVAIERPSNIVSMTSLINEWLDTIRDGNTALWMEGTQKSLAMLTTYNTLSDLLKVNGVAVSDLATTINAIWQYTP